MRQVITGVPDGSIRVENANVFKGLLLVSRKAQINQVRGFVNYINCKFIAQLLPTGGQFPEAIQFFQLSELVEHFNKEDISVIQVYD